MSRKILIIEDSPTVSAMMKDLIESQGCDADIADNGIVGVKKASEGGFDAIIIDTVLPDIDGFDVCRKIRQLKLAKNPKILITTGKIEVVDAGKARAAGADDYTVKTSDMSVLMETLKNLFGGECAAPGNKNKKIVIVEDNPLEMDLLSELLKKDGYVVLGASTGTAGVDLSGKEAPDLVIIDTVLPDMNGLEVCRKIRASFRNRDKSPKIIMTTGKIDVNDAGKSREAGADDYMVKTSDFSYLVETVKKTLT